ncbi:MAG TPA: sulfotransferase [Acidimicrobiales bacterium]|nr:sulfotransferase [Acidimicrobiales bacterium]
MNTAHSSPTAQRLLSVESLSKGFEAGLERFGSAPEGDLVAAGLPLLSHSLRFEAGIDRMGAYLSRRDIRRCIRNRIAIRTALAEGAPAHPVRGALFIAGLPRSGSTLLQRLLAVDPQNRSMRLKEGFYPLANAGIAKWRREVRTRIELGVVKRRSPSVQAAHALGADWPEECLLLLKHTMAAVPFSSFYNVPTYTEWLEAADLGPSYEYLHDAYSYLQGANTSPRWIMKSPVHIFAIKPILDAFPDSVIVQTHRDPVVAVTSMCSLITALRGIMSRDLNRAELGPYVAPRLRMGVDRLLADRAAADPARFYDLPYESLVKDPIGAVKNLYDFTGQSLEAATERAMSAWLNRNHQHKFGVHRYTLEEFGLNRETEAERFAGYSERFAGLFQPAAAP